MHVLNIETMFVSIYVYTRTALFPSLAFPLSLYISTCTDMHMYIYIERKRERESGVIAEEGRLLRDEGCSTISVAQGIEYCSWADCCN